MEEGKNSMQLKLKCDGVQSSDSSSCDVEKSSKGSSQKKNTSHSLVFSVKIALGFILSVVGFVLYYFLFAAGENESAVVVLDSSNTDVDGLNAYYNELLLNYASSPEEFSVYSNMGRDGAPTLSGLEPDDLKNAILEKFPDLVGLKADRYIISATVLNEDKDAKWGILYANVRGHVNQSVLLSPDQVRRVQMTAGTDKHERFDDRIDVTIPYKQHISRRRTSNGFNWDEATAALHHAQTCYCEEDTYMTRTYGGPLSGFVATYHISNPRYDTAGYIGYSATDETIHISFRGSVSLNNWLTTNIDVISTSYSLCSDCRVHAGFYDAAIAVFPDVLAEVQQLRRQFPNYKVVVSGHSLGGALSHLTALELDAAGISNVELYTFGSPRVTNTELAEYSTSRFPTASRVTHAKDLVVHTPGRIFYTHMAGEWHQPEGVVDVIECFGYEDENCAGQYVFTSIEDHMEYLGLEMGTDGCAGVTYS